MEGTQGDIALIIRRSPERAPGPTLEELDTDEPSITDELSTSEESSSTSESYSDEEDASTYEGSELSDTGDGTLIRTCRICLEDEGQWENLIAPCLCSGNSKYVHKSCLQKWRDINAGRRGGSRCMECAHPYRIRYKHRRETFKVWSVCLRNPLLGWELVGINLAIFNLSGILRLVDNTTTYDSILPGVDQNATDVLKVFLKKDSFQGGLFYYIWTTTALLSLFYLFFIVSAFIAIQRPILYIRKGGKYILGHWLWCLQVIPLYHGFRLGGIFGVEIFINLASLLTITQTLMAAQFLRSHNSIIDQLNAANNGEVLPLDTV